MKFGVYELLGQVAAGGFGEVWRAARSDREELFALKMIHSRLLRDPLLVRRFQQEIAACTALHHANVVPIVDHGISADGTPYYVMPLIRGRTLREQLRATGAFEVQEARRIFVAVCDAVESAHQAGIVHRDIKSSNVLVDEHGVPRVCDFGLAKLLADEGPNLTRSREVLGTPACMAPEQATGGQVDHRADIYSLGVLLYELIAGTLPFDYDGMTVLTQLHAYAKRPALPERSDVPTSLNRIIAKAMHIEVEGRYRSVAELRDAVDTCLSPPRVDESVASWLLFVEDHQTAIEDSEDLLDAFEEAFGPDGGSIVLRASRRMIVALRCTRWDEPRLIAQVERLIGSLPAWSAHQRVNLKWRDGILAQTPSALQWPEALTAASASPSSQLRTLRLR